MAISTRTQSLAKTTRPALSSTVVARPRLFDALDRGREGPAIWVQGPPGAGKTSLVSSYVEARGVPVLWYQLDVGDAEPASFFSHLLHALRRRTGDAARPSAPPDPAAAESAMRALFRDVYGSFAGEFVLVLDNCHEVPVTSSLHAVLALAAEEVPRRGSVIFLGRDAPPATLATLRARGAVTLITAEDLELTVDELCALAAARGAALAESEAGELRDAARGWAAGAVLMLEHARSGGAVARTPAGIAPQVVFDYLGGEVFERFEPGVRDTLCAIAGLPRCTASLAAAVSSDPRAGAALENLSRNSYFVTGRDEGSDTLYELHPLFRRFLLARGRERFGEAERAEHVRRGAEWLEAAGRIEEAAELLVDARDWERLAALLAVRARALLADGCAADLGRWLAALPEAVRDAHPWLLYWSGVTRATSDPRAARRRLERAHRGFESVRPRDRDGAALSACAVVDAIVAELDDLALLDPWLPVLESALREHGDDGDGAVAARIAAALYVASVLRGAGAGRLDAVRAAAIGDARGGVDVEASAVAAAAGLVGCLRADFAAVAGMLASPDDGSPWLALLASFYHLLRGEADAGLAALARARELAGDDGAASPALLAAALAEAFRVGAAGVGAGGDPRAPVVLPGYGPARLRLALESYLEGVRLAALGDVLAAFPHLRAAAVAAAQLGLGPLEVLCQCALAEAAADCGDRPQAERALAAARPVCPEGFALLDFVRKVACANVERAAGGGAAAVAAVGDALAAGRARGLRFTPGFAPARAAACCALALEADIERDYARSLLRAHGLAARAPDGAPEAWPWPLRVFAMGGLRVLRHDEALRLSGKGEGRLVELLKVLIALGGREVPQEQIAEALWPHVEADYAYRSFTTTIYRLRKLVDLPEAIVVEQGRVGFNPGCCWLDTWALEAKLDAVDALFWSGPASPDESRVLALADDLARLHRGPFLAGDEQQPSVAARRARLRRRVLRGLTRLASHFEASGQAQRGVDLMQRALDVDPGAEGASRELMLLLERLGRRAEALEVFALCQAALAADGGGGPGDETAAIAARLAAGVRR